MSKHQNLLYFQELCEKYCFFLHEFYQINEDVLEISKIKYPHGYNSDNVWSEIWRMDKNFNSGLYITSLNDKIEMDYDIENKSRYLRINNKRWTFN